MLVYILIISLCIIAFYFGYEFGGYVARDKIIKRWDRLNHKIKKV